MLIHFQVVERVTIGGFGQKSDKAKKIGDLSPLGGYAHYNTVLDRVDWTMNHKDIYKADSLKSDQTVTDSYYTDDQL